MLMKVAVAVDVMRMVRSADRSLLDSLLLDVGTEEKKLDYSIHQYVQALLITGKAT